MNTIEVTYNEIVPTAPQPDWYVVEITNSKGFTFYREEFDACDYDSADAMYTAFWQKTLYSRIICTLSQRPWINQGQTFHQFVTNIYNCEINRS